MPQGMQGSALTEALNRSKEEDADPEPQADNPEDEDPQGGEGQSGELPEKYYDANGELKSPEELASMHANLENKLGEQSEVIQEQRDKLNQMEGKVEAIGGGESEEPEEPEPRSNEEILQEAKRRLEERMDEDDEVAMDPAAQGKFILEEVNRLMEQREDRTNQQLQQLQSQRFNQRASKARKLLEETHPEAEQYGGEMAKIVEEDPSISEKVHQAPSVEETLPVMRELLVRAKLRRGEDPTLSTNDDEDPDDDGSNTDASPDTSRTSVTGGTSSSESRAGKSSEQRKLESITESLEKGMKQTKKRKLGSARRTDD